MRLADGCKWSPDGWTLYYKAHALPRAARRSGLCTRQAGVRASWCGSRTWTGSRTAMTSRRTGTRLYFAIEDRQSNVWVADTDDLRRPNRGISILC